MTPKPGTRHPAPWRPWAWRLAAVFLALGLAWLGWPFSLGYLRTQNPTLTSMMKFRQAQARTRHLPYRVRQTWVSLDRISPWLPKAAIAAEDDTYYQHAGVDFDDLWESVKQDWREKQYTRGGSSITQQVAKNLFLSPRKLLVRKLKEFFLAFRLDRALGKARVLEIYLNIAEWGPGVFGAEAAARRYFHKSAADLTLDEAVGLAAVLPSPLRHTPLQTGRYVQWRKAWILARLHRAGVLKAPVAVPEPGAPEWTEPDEDDADLALPDYAGNTAAAESLQSPASEAEGATPAAAGEGDFTGLTPAAQ